MSSHMHTGLLPHTPWFLTVPSYIGATSAHTKLSSTHAPRLLSVRSDNGAISLLRQNLLPHAPQLLSLPSDSGALSVLTHSLLPHAPRLLTVGPLEALVGTLLASLPQGPEKRRALLGEPEHFCSNVYNVGITSSNGSYRRDASITASHDPLSLSLSLSGR